MCVSYKQQQQHHVCVVAHAGYVQRRPQIFILMVHVQPSLDQELGRKHIVMASTLQKKNKKKKRMKGN